MANGRIGYVDAMRGFTMILVVYAHVCHFCFGSSLMGFDNIFFLFRQPCFFFISGWLFEPVARRPFWTVARRKFMVQIVPTFVFLLLLAPPPQFFAELGAVKGGYWFTFVLFEFFIIYMLTLRLFGRWNIVAALAVGLGAYVYARYYNMLTVTGVLPSSVWHLLGFLSVVLWRYYIYFFLGTLVRRHFDTFIRFTNHPLVPLLLAACFLGVASTSHTASLVHECLRFYLGGILGMLMVFTLFRRYCPPRMPVLEYIGTRTLDVYLLHYFFLPRFLRCYSAQLFAYDSTVLEFCVAMPIALLVLAVTLGASRIIRLSPFLGHFLFGVKYRNP